MSDLSYRDEGTRIELLKFILPNYQTACLIASKAGKKVARITFAISPISLGEVRSNNFQFSKTSGGWFAQRLGPSLVPVSFSGYMLNMEGYLEKHQFLTNWQKYIQDTKGDNMDYSNDYSLSFICLGREYSGVMQSISIQSSSSQQFLHQYSCSFTSFSDRYIYKPDVSKVYLSSGAYSVATTESMQASSKIYSILKG